MKKEPDNKETPTSKKSKPVVSKLVLLDVHAIIHRAYHAMPQFSTRNGEPTGGLYGIVSMLFSLFKELSPDYVIACYDLPKPTYRHEIFKEYKAGRKKADDELVSQIIRSHEIFKAFNIPEYSAEGFEADDMLGTIVEQMKERDDVDIVIASGDMDTLQLVTKKKVQVYTLRKGIKDTVLYDEKKVKERYGFGPNRLIDYKGLRGDPSDNIPGIKGIGDKGATDLIAAFGTLEQILKAKDKGEEFFVSKGFTKRVFNLISDQEEEAQFSKLLATIRRDSPITFILPEQKWRETLEREVLENLFRDLEFRAFGDRVNSLLADGGAPEEEQEEISEEVMTEAALKLWVADSNFTNPTLADILGFTETKLIADAITKLDATLENQGTTSIYEDIEKPLSQIVADMKSTGIMLDIKFLAKLSKEYHVKLTKLERGIWEKAGREFNINSPKQMGEVLFDELGIKTKKAGKTASGAKSTREDVLQEIKGENPIIEEILAYRELQKLLSTYIDVLPKLADKEGRVHPTFLQSGTTTGRMASAEPNIQNIPIKSELGREIRRGFVAPEGRVLLACDYSQIELRLAAVLSEDEKFTSIFQKGNDVHTEVASYMFHVDEKDVTKEMRRKAKVINFGILYGMGVQALQKNLDVSREEAKEFYNNYFETFTGLAAYLDTIKADTARKGFTETLFGRRRYFKGFSSPLPYIRAQAERMAINAPIQGTSADGTKLAMIRVHNWIAKEKLEKKVSLLLQIHDELLFEIDADCVDDLTPKIVEMMQDVFPKEKMNGVPIIVNAQAGTNWANLEEI